jgi:hypothetical protein
MLGFSIKPERRQGNWCYFFSTMARAEDGATRGAIVATAEYGSAQHPYSPDEFDE